MKTSRKTTAGTHYVYHDSQTAEEVDEGISMLAFSILISLVGIVSIWGFACLGATLQNSGLLRLCRSWLTAITGF